MLDTADPKLKSVVERLAAQLATKRDIMADTRKITLGPKFDGDGFDPDFATGETVMLVDLPGGVEELPILDHTHGQIGAHLDINRKLYLKLLGGQPDGNGGLTAGHPHLLHNLVNGLFQEDPSKRRIRTLDDKARAFLGNGYRPRDNWDLFEQVIMPTVGKLPNTVTIREATLTETHMYLKFGLPQFQRAITPKVGDIVEGGFIVKNSEVGASALGIFPYTTILRCTNGQVHVKYGQNQRHVGKRTAVAEEAFEIYSEETLQLDDAAFFSKCRDLVTATLNETVFDAIVGEMQALAGIPILAPPIEAVEVLGKRHGITEAEQHSMIEALLSGREDRTLWGLVNAITETARDHENADRRVELQTLAGDMIHNPALVTV